MSGSYLPAANLRKYPTEQPRTPLGPLQQTPRHRVLLIDIATYNDYKYQLPSWSLRASHVRRQTRKFRPEISDMPSGSGFSGSCGWEGRCSYPHSRARTRFAASLALHLLSLILKNDTHTSHHVYVELSRAGPVAPVVLRAVRAAAVVPDAEACAALRLLRTSDYNSSAFTHLHGGECERPHNSYSYLVCTRQRFSRCAVAAGR